MAPDGTPKEAGRYKRLKPKSTNLAVIGTVMLLIVFLLAAIFFRSWAIAG
jgi:hypothetical protein